MLKSGILYYYPPETSQTFLGDELDKLISQAQSLGIIKKEGLNNWHYNGFNIKGRPNLKVKLGDETLKIELENKIQLTLSKGRAKRVLDQAREDYFQKKKQYPTIAILNHADWEEGLEYTLMEVYRDNDPPQRRLQKYQVLVGN